MALLVQLAFITASFTTVELGEAKAFLSLVLFSIMQSNAEQAVRQLLRDFSKDQGLKEIDTVSAEEHMDDGTPIRLAVTIDRNEGSALLDFEGMLSTLCMPGRVIFV